MRISLSLGFRVVPDDLEDCNLLQLDGAVKESKAKTSNGGTVIVVISSCIKNRHGRHEHGRCAGSVVKICKPKMCCYDFFMRTKQQGRTQEASLLTWYGRASTCRGARRKGDCPSSV